jgi:hypothetical protein
LLHFDHEGATTSLAVGRISTETSLVTRMRHWLTAAGLLTVLAGVVLALWPIHANGVDGTALTPHYKDFGWYAATPLPSHPTFADLRSVGITPPPDVVNERRRDACIIGAVGLVIVVGAQLLPLVFRRSSAAGEE